MKYLKKTRYVVYLSIILILSLTSAHVFGLNEAPVSPGPAPDSGDGTPSGNQYIQPETSGMGPAPNSGDGVSDGSGFP